jgi:hypothetical protein
LLIGGQLVGERTSDSIEKIRSFAGFILSRADGFRMTTKSSFRSHATHPNESLPG